MWTELSTCEECYAISVKLPVNLERRTCDQFQFLSTPQTHCSVRFAEEGAISELQGVLYAISNRFSAAFLSDDQLRLVARTCV